MPLKIRVKPEAKIYAGGAVLKNVGTRPADLLILSDGPVLREDYMMNPDRKTESDAASVYFLPQLVYLFKGKGAPLDSLVISTLQSFSKIYPAYQGKVDEMIQHLESDDAFKALKIGHELLEMSPGASVMSGMKNELQETLTGAVTAPVLAEQTI